MHRLYHAWTPNVIKVAVALEEMNLPYERVSVDFGKDEQTLPAFLAISPNGKVPALVDGDPPGGGEPFALFESGAILIYLAEKAGRFLPTSPRERSTVLQWLMWQMAGFGPMLGQAHQFLHFAPEVQPFAINRYVKETARLYGVLERRLQGREYICEDYSIADMACWPWAIYHDLHHQTLSHHPAVQAWFERVGERPAVRRATEGIRVPTMELRPEIARVLEK